MELSERDCRAYVMPLASVPNTEGERTQPIHTPSFPFPTRDAEMPWAWPRLLSGYAALYDLVRRPHFDFCFPNLNLTE